MKSRLILIIAHKDLVECDEHTSPRVRHMQMTRPKSQTVYAQGHGRYVYVSLFNIWLLDSWFLFFNSSLAGFF